LTTGINNHGNNNNNVLIIYLQDILVLRPYESDVVSIQFFLISTSDNSLVNINLYFTSYLLRRYINGIRWRVYHRDHDGPWRFNVLQL